MSDWPDNMLVKPIVTWPGELTSRRSTSPFSATWSSTLQLLARELREVSATARVLQVAIPESDFRIDGYPRANAATTAAVRRGTASRPPPWFWG